MSQGMQESLKGDLALSMFGNSFLSIDITKSELQKPMPGCSCFGILYSFVPLWSCYTSK